jgi:predicted nucleic acid-binding protein
MRITPDTNVLLRAILNDDAAQAERARELLAEAEEVVLTFVALADGIIAYDGARQHGETYATFDQKAAAVVQARGGAVLLLD